MATSFSAYKAKSIPVFYHRAYILLTSQNIDLIGNLATRENRLVNTVTTPILSLSPNLCGDKMKNIKQTTHILLLKSIDL